MKPFEVIIPYWLALTAYGAVKFVLAAYMQHYYIALQKMRAQEEYSILLIPTKSELWFNFLCNFIFSLEGGLIKIALYPLILIVTKQNFWKYLDSDYAEYRWRKQENRS